MCRPPALIRIVDTNNVALPDTASQDGARIRGEQSNTAGEERKLKAAPKCKELPKGGGKKGNKGGSKGGVRMMSEDNFPFQARLASGNTSILQVGIFEVVAECQIASLVIMNVTIRSPYCEPLFCISDGYNDGGNFSANFGVPVTSLLWGVSFPGNNIDSGAYMCSDFSYLGFTVERIVGASMGFNKTAFGGSDCIIGGAFQYQELK